MKALRTILFGYLILAGFMGCGSESSGDKSAVEGLIESAVKAQKQRQLFRWFEIRDHKTVNWPAAYQNYDSLYSTKAIQLVSEVTDANLGEEGINTLEYFKRALISDFIDARQVVYRQRLHQLIQREVAVGSDSLTIAELPKALGETANFGQARALFNGFSDSLQLIFENYNLDLATRRALAETLEYPSYLELEAYLYNFNPRLINRLCDDLLSQTDAIYQVVFNRLVTPYTNRRLPNLYLADLYRVKGRYRFETEIPAEKFDSLTQVLLTGLGISKDRQPGFTVVIDDSARVPYAPFTAIVDIPDDVRLTAVAQPGLHPHQQYLGEMAFAQNALYNQNQSEVFKYLYHSPTVDAFRLLFSKIWENPSWIEDHFQATPRNKNRFRDYQIFSQLCQLRLVAARLKYEMRYFSFPEATTAAESTETRLAILKGFLEPALQISLSDDEAIFLLSQSLPIREAAAFLQGTIIEAGLRSYLETKFGEKWFQKVEAGSFLKSMWRRGNRFSVPTQLKMINTLSLQAATYRFHLENLLQRNF